MTGVNGPGKGNRDVFAGEATRYGHHTAQQERQKAERRTVILGAAGYVKARQMDAQSFVDLLDHLDLVDEAEEMLMEHENPFWKLLDELRAMTDVAEGGLLEPQASGLSNG